MKPKLMDRAQGERTMQRSMDKATELYRVLQPILNRSGTHNDMAEWANALAIQAGAVLGLLHYHTKVPKSFDETAAKGLERYIRLGMGIGRDQ